MTNALGDALGKLSLRRHQTTAEKLSIIDIDADDAASGVAATQHALPNSSTEFTAVQLPVDTLVITVMTPTSCGISNAQLELQPSPMVESVEHISSPAMVPPVLMTARPRRNPLEFALDHRRRAAAVVVLLCMALVWLDEGSDRQLTNGVPQSPQEKLDDAEGELMLSEFDGIEVKPMREPADPVNELPEEFSLTIPSTSMASQQSLSEQKAGSPASAYPMGIPGSSERPAADVRGDGRQNVVPSTVGNASAGSPSVRFAGRIEPLR